MNDDLTLIAVVLDRSGSMLKQSPDPGKRTTQVRVQADQLAESLRRLDRIIDRIDV